MATVIAPAPFAQFGTVFPTGAGYTADASGIITNVPIQDLDTLRISGCEQVGVAGSTGALIGRLLGANMNVTTDQPIPMFISPSMAYRPTKISVRNASTSLTTAAGGVYTAVSKGGTAIVAATQAYSSLTGATLNLDLTIVVAVVSLTVLPAGTLLYLSLTTAQGAAATADLFLYGDLMS
jgi:hypothetical protein